MPTSSENNCLNSYSMFPLRVALHIGYIAALSGQKFAQVNVLIGQRGRFEANCSLFIEDPIAHPYACMRETYMPLFWYQHTGELTPAIAALVAPNIKAAATAHTAMLASVYVGAILGGACLLVAAWVIWPSVFAYASAADVGIEARMSGLDSMETPMLSTDPEYENHDVELRGYPLEASMTPHAPSPSNFYEKQPDGAFIEPIALSQTSSTASISAGADYRF
jgi:hypothetical protein